MKKFFIVLVGMCVMASVSGKAGAQTTSEPTAGDQQNTAVSPDRQKKLDEIKQMVASFNEEEKPLQDQREAIMEKIKQAGDQIKQIGEQFKPIKDQIKQITDQIKPLTEQLKPLEEQLKPFNEQVKPLAEQIKTLNAQLKPLNEKIKLLDQERSELGIAKFPVPPKAKGATKKAEPQPAPSDTTNPAP